MLRSTGVVVKQCGKAKSGDGCCDCLRQIVAVVIGQRSHRQHLG
jgi:hypothetical protein